MKKYYELTEEECKKHLKLANEAIKNTYPESGKGYAVALMTKTGNIYTRNNSKPSDLSNKKLNFQLWQEKFATLQILYAKTKFST